MMKNIAPLIQKNKVIGAVVVLVILLGVVVAFTKREPDVSVPQRKEFEVRGAGRLPNLTTVMKTNAELRRKVKDFCAKDEGYVFGDPDAADREIVEILLMWSGIDLDEPVTKKTREGLHPHVDHFIRAVFDMRDTSPIVKNPLVGNDPWLRLFSRYKVRLIVQCAAGQKVYNGDILYDVELDRLTIKGGLSPDFINGFKSYVATKENPKRYINNLLAYIDDTKGLKKLSDEEKELIKF